MQTTLTAQTGEAEFRAAIEDFLARELPADMARRNLTAVHWSREDMLNWTAILHRQGWSVPHWPLAHGGTGWTGRQRQIFDETLFAAGAPPLNMQAISLAGPVLYSFGSDEQKARFLPDIRAGKVFWAQGFSEPNAGSDLASLRTTALREGDDYVINGQKIWTSQAHFADWLFLLVRTDPAAPKRDGISFILCPANAPGVTIRPITSIDGGISLCEVFLENVRVPAENLVGEAGKGWGYANFLLANERTTTAEIPRNRRMLARLKALAGAHQRGGSPLIEDPAFATRIRQYQLELGALETSVQRVLANSVPAQYPMASCLKLRGSEILQGLLELQVETLGSRGAIAMHEDPVGLSALAGLEDGLEVTEEYLFRRAATIYGGASEIQRSIIGKQVLKIDPNASLSYRLSEDQAMLADSLRRLIAQRYDFTTREADLAGGVARLRANWQALAETGLTAMALSEEAGGLGSSLADLAVAAEMLGSALVCEPFVFSAVLAAGVVERAAGPDSRWLTGVAEGESLLVAGFGEDSHLACDAVAEGQGFRLDGGRAMVIAAAAADVFIVKADLQGAGPTLFAVPATTAGVSRTDYRLYDGRLASDLRFDGVLLAAEHRLGTPGQAQEILEPELDTARLLLAAEALGAMSHALWVTRDYVLTRRQFNSALADFQAVQHRLADMYVELEQARSALLRGLDAMHSAGGAARAEAASAAKALICQSGRKLTGSGIQLHGGIGLTEECIIGHFFKRLMVSDQLLGTAQMHLKRIRLT